MVRSSRLFLWEERHPSALYAWKAYRSLRIAYIPRPVGTVYESTAWEAAGRYVMRIPSPRKDHPVRERGLVTSGPRNFALQHIVMALSRIPQGEF